MDTNSPGKAICVRRSAEFCRPGPGYWVATVGGPAGAQRHINEALLHGVRDLARIVFVERDADTYRALRAALKRERAAGLRLLHADLFDVDLPAPVGHLDADLTEILTPRIADRIAGLVSRYAIPSFALTLSSRRDAAERLALAAQYGIEVEAPDRPLGFYRRKSGEVVRNPRAPRPNIHRVVVATMADRLPGFEFTTYGYGGACERATTDARERHGQPMICLFGRRAAGCGECGEVSCDCGRFERGC
jgi:hypothetical protein